MSWWVQKYSNDLLKAHFHSDVFSKLDRCVLSKTVQYARRANSFVFDFSRFVDYWTTLSLEYWTVFPFGSSQPTSSCL